MYNPVIDLGYGKDRLVYPVDLTDCAQELSEISEKLGFSKAEAIRDSIRNYHESLKGFKVIQVREIPRKQAEKEILAFVKKKGRAFTSEIADELRLDVIVVNDMLQKLAEKGVVK